MEPQDNKRVALQKAISAHEQAAAALTDLMTECSDRKYDAQLERIQQNITELQGDAATTTSEQVV
jgi:cob(I)alamin adenosyltransferase